MSGWSSSADRSSIPKHLPDHIKDACVRTARGWEIPMGGNGNPNADMELIVAMGLNTFSTGANDAPTVVFTDNDYTNRATSFLGIHEGISGSAIEPVTFFVIDLEQSTTDGLTATSASLPAGLELSTAGDYAFTITGTPSTTATETSFITVSDGITNLSYGISWSITE